MARAASTGRKPYNIQLVYDTGAADMIGAYKDLVREFGLSKFPQYLGESVHRISDRRFNIAARESKDAIKHMFEWNTVGATPGSRLWETYYVKGTGFIGYTYMPSKRLVPAADEFTKYRHKFVNKAAAMEEAPTVTIAPDQSQYLRWRSGGTEVRSYGAIEMPVAGGVYKGKFQAFFLTFWATGGAGTVGEVAHALRSSSKFRLEYRKNQIAGLKRKVTNQQKAARRGNGATKAMAAQRIKEIEMEILKLGGTL